MPDFVISEQTRPKDIRELVKSVSPGWLKGWWGERLLGAFSVVLDYTLEGALRAVEAGQMRSPNFPDDGLDYKGSERMLPRFPGELHDNYKDRLLDAWRIWQQAGTAGGITYLFQKLGIVSVIKRNYEWNWDWDTANWSRFWVVVTTHPWTAGPPIGTFNPIGNNTTIGTTATRDEVRAVRDIVRRHKAGMEVCPYICIVLNVPNWNADQPDGTWRYAEDRNPYARYWKG